MYDITSTDLPGGDTVRHLIALTAAFAATSLPEPASAQEIIGFDRDSYGSVVLKRTQSAGAGGMQFELSVGQYNNESIQNYSPQSVFATMGHSVGRLDILTDAGIFPCTAFIVSKKHILTNYHCVPGILDNTQTGATRIDAVQFVAGYVQQGVEEGTRTYTVSPAPVEAHEDLDYAVLEVLGNPSAEYGMLELSGGVPQDGDPYWVIGHPMGEAQRISREKCRANRPALSGHQLLHTCDTLPGNSGSPVIDTSLRQVIGLHHAGSKRDAVNFAIPMKDILKRSQVLVAGLGSGVVSDASGGGETPPPTEDTAGADKTAMCDGLYAEAKDLNQCFAYDAYLSLCEGHPYAVFAQGYVASQCGDTGGENVVTHDPTPPAPPAPPQTPTYLRPWCSSANLNNTEWAICNDAYLAGLDEQMSRAYSSQSHTSASQQGSWRTGTRDACGSNTSCISRVVLDRITYLNNPPAPPPPTNTGSYRSVRGNYTLGSNQCYIVTASRTSVSEAQRFIAQWFPRHTGTRIFHASNGYYGVVYETTSKSRADARLAQLKSQGTIPSDSYCSVGSRYVAEIVYGSGGGGGGGAPAPSGYTMYVDNNSDMSLNVRSGPSTSNRIVTEIPSGQTVTVVGSSGKWSNIITKGGTRGWVYSPLLTSNRPSATRTCTGWVTGLRPISQYNTSTGAGFLSVRSEPNTRTGRRLTELYLGDRVTVLRQSGNWAMVRCASGQCKSPYRGIAGATGWASKKYLRIQCN
ncbi:SH3 domain-containing protein [Pacificoceanicola onchidii]|uniref:SH3 domain-containing protein n=1 Tax=Pacificoceanicola onchidii TaxID=2562685 RepID=UPI0010A36D0A|nr:SH3 domain-containing protein [Pacificoceanicola onchidii]